MKVPVSSIPRASTLPPGNWLLAIDYMEPFVNGTGLFALRATFHSREPIAGLFHYEIFTIGSPEDPTAEQPATWIGSTEATRLMLLLDHAKVTLAPEVELKEMCQAAQDHEVDAVALQVNKQGETRLSSYFDARTLDKASTRTALAKPPPMKEEPRIVTVDPIDDPEDRPPMPRSQRPVPRRG